MKDRDALQRPSIPVAYLEVLSELLLERGIGSEALFAGVGVDRAALVRPEARISAQHWTRVVLNALRLTGDPALGYEYGLRLRPSAHGFMGYATLSCGSMREAIDITLRYIQSRQRIFTLHLATQGEYGTVEVRETRPIPVLRNFFYENLLIGLARGAAAILGLELTQFKDGEIWFDWPEPAYHAAYRERLPRVRFNRPANLLRFPVRMLELKPVLADPYATRQAIALCERELEQAGGPNDNLGLRVCAALQLGAREGYPSLDAVAARLNLSSRSLHRKLQASGTSYLRLLEEARRRDAHELLAQDGVELQAIAARLGYRNPANFTRAFRRWTGASPSEYRARLKREGS
jgi:AraC-like DNA-binding protein